MSEALTLGLICAAASLLGAVVGGALIWWLLRGRARSAAQQEAAPRPPAPRSPPTPWVPQVPHVPHVPAMQPEPVYMKQEAVPELTDEEVDAMLPELPAPPRPRKRIMTAPKKPTYQRL